MHMADSREQVVFHLEIEATEQPRYCTAACSEIGSGAELVDHPFLFDFAAPGIRCGELGGFHYVG